MLEDIRNSDVEIENILNESPLIGGPKAKPKLKEKSLKDPKKKPKFSKKKVFLTIAIIIVIVGIIILVIPTNPDCGDKTTDTMSNSDFVNIVKQQILSQGYAELSDGITTIKVAPYVG